MVIGRLPAYLFAIFSMFCLLGCCFVPALVLGSVPWYHGEYALLIVGTTFRNRN